MFRLTDIRGPWIFVTNYAPLFDLRRVESNGKETGHLSRYFFFFKYLTTVNACLSSNYIVVPANTPPLPLPFFFFPQQYHSTRQSSSKSISGGPNELILGSAFRTAGPSSLFLRVFSRVEGRFAEGRSWPRYVTGRLACAYTRTHARTRTSRGPGYFHPRY